MRHYYVEAIILAMAIVIFGTIIRSSLDRFADKERVVTVKGLSEREVPADKVVWPLIYKELGNEPAEIYQRIEKKNATVIDFLKKHGLSDEEIMQNPPQVKDRFADSWSHENITEEYGSNMVKYEFAGLNDIKPEMVEESTKNARATAEKFAKDSDSELGKIRRATQGQFSISNRDNNTPYIKNVRVVSTIEYYIKDWWPYEDESDGGGEGTQG